MCEGVEQVEGLASRSPPATVNDSRVYETPEKANRQSHVDSSAIRGRRLFQNGKDDNPTVSCSPGRKRRRSVESV